MIPGGIYLILILAAGLLPVPVLLCVLTGFRQFVSRVRRATMKASFLVGLTVALLLVFDCQPARANLIVRFDETGLFRISGGLGVLARYNGDVTTRSTDPVTGGMSLVWIFPAAFGLVRSGEVVVRGVNGDEPRGDMLRFTNAMGTMDGNANADRLIFYSEGPEQGETAQLADIGVPTPMTRSPSSVDERGREGNNNFEWAPSGPVPGSQPGGPIIIYRGVSDNPEPSTFVVATVSCVIGLGFWYRRKQGRANQVE
jgi:hypothetical protein